MANDIDINSLSVRTASDSDYLIASVGSRASRVKISSVKSSASNWSSVQNKPFDSVNADDFGITTDTFSGKSTLGISKSITQKVHSHTNKNVLDKFSESNETGVLLYNGQRIEASSVPWNGVSGKPFSDISEDDFFVFDSTVSLSEDIKNQLHSHTNKEIVDKFSTDSEGQLLFDGKAIKGDSAGLDFTALSNSLTGGSLSGISITPNADTQTFDITVDANSIMQSISINDDGYWVINGEVTSVSGKGIDGENGKDGITPSISPTNHHWMIGETDTGVTAKGADGYSPTISLTDITNGVKVTVTNKDGTSQTADIFNGADGKDGTTTIRTTKKDITCTFLKSAWSDTLPYSQTVSAAEITAALNPRIDVIISDEITKGIAEEKAYSYITRAVTGDGTITAFCYEHKPAVDLNITVEVI